MDEIWKLQQEFKQLQEQDTVHRLSERNCVEIIMKLIQQNKLNVIYTVDGKEYVTYHQLELEIKDEILAHQGRVNVVDLQPILNVDLSYVEKVASELVRKDRNLRIIQGEIIADYYLETVCEEINQALQEAGELTIDELARRFNLSSEFLGEFIEPRLNKEIKGFLDMGILYTHAFVNRITAQVRGIFSAITRPTYLHTIPGRFNFQEKLFYSVLDKLIQEGRLGGVVQGRMERAQYVPDIYAENRDQSIASFFTQNGYISYDQVSKMGVKDGVSYLKNKFPQGTQLKILYISSDSLIQVDGAISNAIHDGGWVDVMTHLPSVVSPADGYLILQSNPHVQQAQKNGDAVLLGETYVATKAFLRNCLGHMERKIEENANKPENKKLFSMLSMSGGDEDEGKGKKGKKVEEPKGKKAPAKKKGRGKDDDDDDIKPTKKSGGVDYSKLFPHDEMLNELKKHHGEDNEELLEEIYQHLASSLLDKAKAISQSLFLSSATASSAGKKVGQDLVLKFDNLYFNFLLFQEGAKSFPGDQAPLEKHLLRTLGTDILNLLLELQALHNFIDASKGIKTAADRTVLLSKFPPPVAKSFEKLTKTLVAEKSDDFLAALTEAAEKCELKLKKFDKKASRQLGLSHREELMKQLVDEQNPAKIFHLVLVLFYFKAYGSILHVPGKSLSAVLPTLQDKVAADIFEKLEDFSAKVVEFLKATEEEPETSKLDGEPIKALILGGVTTETKKTSTEPTTESGEH